MQTMNFPTARSSRWMKSFPAVELNAAPLHPPSPCPALLLHLLHLPTSHRRSRRRHPARRERQARIEPEPLGMDGSVHSVWPCSSSLMQPLQRQRSRHPFHSPFLPVLILPSLSPSSASASLLLEKRGPRRRKKKRLPLDVSCVIKNADEQAAGRFKKLCRMRETYLSISDELSHCRSSGGTEAGGDERRSSRLLGATETHRKSSSALFVVFPA